MHGQYHVMAFAIFHLTGWSTNGNNAGGTLDEQCDASADGGANDCTTTSRASEAVFKGFTTQARHVPADACDRSDDIAVPASSTSITDLSYDQQGQKGPHTS